MTTSSGTAQNITSTSRPFARGAIMGEKRVEHWKLAPSNSQRLAAPLRWRKPKNVRLLSDLFHEDVPFEFIAAVFGVMAACPQHTFQCLTKRPERALAFLEWASENIGEPDYYARFFDCDPAMRQAFVDGRAEPTSDWPLKNVWLGVSIATQADADKNIPVLLKCPAAVRFVSAEPLIEAVNFEHIGNALFDRGAALRKAMTGPMALNAEQADSHIASPELDWVIVGCESGANPRGHHDYETHARSIIQQCGSAGVACFHKQMPIRRPSNIGYHVSHDPAEWQEDLRVREFPLQTVKP